MKLPYMPNTAGRNQKQIVTFRGVNWSDRYQEGELRDSLNLSTRRLPYLSTRRARRQMDAYQGATAMTARGSLVVVQGTDLVYDGQVVGQVMAGEKQFAVVNTKLVIWPDKVYLDLNSKTMGTLGASVSGAGAVFNGPDGTITVSGWGDLTQKFKPGDALNITGCTTAANNQELVVKTVESSKLGFGANTLTTANEAESITIERRVPDLDYICESENRLWGCSSKTQSIYASALGDPTNFYVYEGVSTDGYALAVGTEGDFTGCCKLSSSVLFWKETKLHKLLGSYPAEYTMYTYDIEGLQAGCHKSLQVINEVLYYQGLHGVFAYSGGMPSMVSDAFGQRVFTGGVGGSDGDTYFLSVLEGEEPRLLVYETRQGIWLQEDGTKVTDFARVGKDLYFLDSGGKVWLEDSGAEDGTLPWMAQFAPFYDTAEGRKVYSRLLLRVELPKGSWMKAETRCDDGKWREAGKLKGRDADVIPLALPINRCDKFEVRLSGTGPCAVKAMVLEYALGSDV